MSDSTNHGGKRKNAGRPKGEATRMVRVPLGCLERVKFIISAYKLGDSSLVSNEQKMKVMAEDKARDRKKNRNVSSQNTDLAMNEITNKRKKK